MRDNLSKWVLCNISEVIKLQSVKVACFRLLWGAQIYKRDNIFLEVKIYIFH